MPKTKRFGYQILGNFSNFFADLNLRNESTKEQLQKELLIINQTNQRYTNGDLKI